MSVPRTPSRSLALALALANLRYWPTVAPYVRHELNRWRIRARAIPSHHLRAHATAKLESVAVHAEITATLATLAPRSKRAETARAIVAYEVLYDYLDALTEQPTDDSGPDAHHLYRALAAPFTAAHGGHYFHNPPDDDGGYLAALVADTRKAFLSLPAAAEVAATAQRIATRCAQAQLHSHAVPTQGPVQLEAWARTVPHTSVLLTWWERAAGHAAAVLAVHALIAAAAKASTTFEHAERIGDTYIATCALTTLLDSLLDHDDDIATSNHSYISYYPDNQAAAQRLASIAAGASAAAATLPNGPHHAMTVAGICGFYLARANTPRAREAAAAIGAELGPILTPIVLMFRLHDRATR